MLRASSARVLHALTNDEDKNGKIDLNIAKVQYNIDILMQHLFYKLQHTTLK